MHSPILIAHAGGLIQGHGYTNSIEACLQSIATGFKLIELDVVKLADGFGIAHDGTEKRYYGLDINFDQLSFDSFRRLTVIERFTPMTFDLSALISAVHGDITFIIDSKFTNPDDLGALARWIKSRYSDLFKKLIFQVYSVEDANELLNNQAKNVLFALWKNFNNDYLGTNAITEIKKISSLQLDILGISLRCYSDRDRKISNLNDPRLMDLKSLGHRIILHDLGDLDPKILYDDGFGLFLHSISRISNPR